MPAASPNAADGTWVDISQYFVSGSVRRGRSVELDQFQAGSMTVVLEAFSRLFDPENTAGTYYGKLLPMRQIRLSAKWQGVVYPLFRGYVQSWGSTVVSDRLFRTTVTCRDAFMRLEQIELPSSAWALEVLRDNPTLWFRLGETSTAQATDSSAGGNYGIYDNVTQGVAGLIPNDADGAVDIGHSTDERVTIRNPALITGYPFTVEAMVKTDGTNPTYAKTIFAGLKTPSTLNVDSLVVEVQQTTQLIRSKLDSSVGGGRYVTGTTRLDDNLPHHIAVAYATTSSHLIYRDGTDETTVTASGTPTWWTAAASGYTIGNLEDTGLGDYGFDGTVDEVVVYDGTALSAARIAAHSLAAKTGWAGDDTGTRVSRFLDAIGWPATLRNIRTGISILGPASWTTGTSALAAMQAWADTEYGAFFVSGDGKITWRSRHYPLLNTDATRSRATFGDIPSGAPILIDDDGLDLYRDATLIRNPVVASRAGGVTVTVRDDNLADQVYGSRSWSSPATQDQADASVRDRASWLLARFKNEYLRCRSLSVSPQTQPAAWPTILGLELGDRITIKRTPLGSGSQISVDQIIESIGWDIPSRFVLQPTFSGSPVDPNVGAYLILDDATAGVLDTAKLGY